MKNIKTYKSLSHIFVLALSVNSVLKCEMFDIEMYVKVMDYNSSNDAIRWRISKSIKVISHLFELFFNELLTFEISYLEQVDQGH